MKKIIFRTMLILSAAAGGLVAGSSTGWAGDCDDYECLFGVCWCDDQDSCDQLKAACPAGDWTCTQHGPTGGCIAGQCTSQPPGYNPCP